MQGIRQQSVVQLSRRREEWLSAVQICHFTVPTSHCRKPLVDTGQTLMDSRTGLLKDGSQAYHTKD